MKLKFLFLLHFSTLLASAQTAQLRLDQGRFAGSNYLIEANKDVFTYSSIVLPSSIFVGAGKLNNITSVSLKNGVLWSNDYISKKRTFINHLAQYKDGFLAAGFVSDVDKNKLLMRLDDKGVVIWSKSYGFNNEVDTVNAVKSEAIVLADGNIALAGGASVFASSAKQNDLFLAKIDQNGKQIWSKSYCFSCLGSFNTTFGNVIQSSDGGFYICGSLDNANDFKKSVVLLKTNALGELQWVRTYENPDNGGFLNNDLGEKVILQPNGNLIVIANKEQGASQDATFVMQLKPDGTLIKAIGLRQNPNATHTLQLNDVINDGNDNIIVSASTTLLDSQLPTNGKEENLMFKLNLNGTIEWQHNYYDETWAGFGTRNFNVLRRKSGGYALLTNFAENFDNLFPILILTDDKGKTGCELVSNILLEKDFKINSKTLTVSEKTSSDPINYEMVKKNFDFKINFPKLNLGADTVLCPDKNQINLDASNPIFETYSWNTGIKTPTILIEKAGIFSVTVTNKSNCLSLSDTIVVTEKKDCNPTTTNDSVRVFIPSVFTPDDNGPNDTFLPFGDNFEVTLFQIFGRWGELIFEANDTVSAVWDGKFRGNPMASDVYVYVLQYKTKGGKVGKKVGDITLLR